MSYEEHIIEVKVRYYNGRYKHSAPVAIEEIVAIDGTEMYCQKQEFSQKIVGDLALHDFIEWAISLTIPQDRSSREDICAKRQNLFCLFRKAWFKLFDK